MFVGISCSESENLDLNGIDNSLGVMINITNTEGSDLLDPNSPYYLDSENIKIFHKVNDELVEWYFGNLDSPYGFEVFSPEEYGFIFGNLYILGLTATNPYYFTNEFEEFVTTYINWNETDMDTLKCQNKKLDYRLYCTKVWYNNQLIWDYYDSSYEKRYRLIHVVKDL